MSALQTRLHDMRAVWQTEALSVKHFCVNNRTEIKYFLTVSQVLTVRLCAFLCFRSSEAGGSRAVPGVLYHLEGHGGGGTGGLYECVTYRTQLEDPDLKVWRTDGKIYILCLSDDLNKCCAIFLKTLVTHSWKLNNQLMCVSKSRQSSLKAQCVKCSSI